MGDTESKHVGATCESQTAAEAELGKMKDRYGNGVSSKLLFHNESGGTV